MSVSTLPSCSLRRLSASRLVRGGFLLGWLQTKLPLTPQPARKWFDTKDPKMSSSPPTSPQTNGTGMRSERNPPPPRPLNSFTYLSAHSEEGVGPGTRDAWRPSGVWGSSATLQDLTGLCLPSASLCLSHNRETQTEQHTICGYTLGQSTLFANANSIVASCHPGTQKRMLIFTWTRTGPLYTGLWPTCSICTSKAQPTVGHTAGEPHWQGRPRESEIQMPRPPIQCSGSERSYGLTIPIQLWP